MLNTLTSIITSKIIKVIALIIGIAGIVFCTYSILQIEKGIVTNKSEIKELVKTSLTMMMFTFIAFLPGKERCEKEH